MKGETICHGCANAIISKSLFGKEVKCAAGQNPDSNSVKKGVCPMFESMGPAVILFADLVKPADSE